MQSESPLQQEPQAQPSEPPPVPSSQEPVPPPVMSAAPPRKSRVGTILLIVFLLLAVGATGWAGYRVSQLRTQLDAATASLTGLQGKYDTLTNEKKSLDGELASVKSELEATQGELSSTQAELKSTEEAANNEKTEIVKIKREIATLKENMKKAWDYNEILRGGFEDEESFFQTYLRILSINDSQLTSLFETYLGNRTDENFDGWIGYILTKIVDLLEK